LPRNSANQIRKPTWRRKGNGRKRQGTPRHQAVLNRKPFGYLQVLPQGRAGKPRDPDEIRRSRENGVRSRRTARRSHRRTRDGLGPENRLKTARSEEMDVASPNEVRAFAYDKKWLKADSTPSGSRTGAETSPSRPSTPNSCSASHTKASRGSGWKCTASETGGLGPRA